MILQQAYQLISLKKYDQAIKLLESHRADHFQEAYYFYLMGLAFLYKKDLAAAENYYKQAIAMEPNHTGYLVAIADVYCMYDRWDLFEQHLESAQALNPNHADIYVVKGKGLLRQRRMEESVVTFNEALRLDPHNQKALDLKAIAQTHNSDFEESLETTKAALEINPNSGLALANMGWRELLSGSHKQAREFFKQALATDPTNKAYILGYKSAVCKQSFLYRPISQLELVFFKKPKLKKPIVIGMGLLALAFIPFSLHFRPGVHFLKILIETFALSFILISIPFKIIPWLSMFYLFTDEYGKTFLSSWEKGVIMVSTSLLLLGLGLILFSQLAVFWGLIIMLTGIFGGSLGEKGESRQRGLQGGIALIVFLLSLYLYISFVQGLPRT